MQCPATGLPILSGEEGLHSGVLTLSRRHPQCRTVRRRRLARLDIGRGGGGRRVDQTVGADYRYLGADGGDAVQLLRKGQRHPDAAVEAGKPGFCPAWIATPSQVSRCMKGMAALL